MPERADSVEGTSTPQRVRHRLADAGAWSPWCDPGRLLQRTTLPQKRHKVW
jgi:hypothetical protein